MNKTKLNICFVIICIMLSFFSTSLATLVSGNAKYITVGTKDNPSDSSDPNVLINQGLEKEGRTTEVTTLHTNTTLTITPHVTGLYTITVKDGNWNEKTEKNGANYRKFKLLNAKDNGKYPRIPAVLEDGKYKLLCAPTTSNNTTVTVYLNANQTYYLYLDGGWNDNAYFTIRYRENGDVINGAKIDYSKLYMSGYSIEGTCRKSAEAGKTKNMDLNLYGLPGIPNDQTKNILIPGDKPLVGLKALQSQNLFEIRFVSLLIAIGDYLTRVLDYIVGEEVTVTNLVFNRVKAVNPNFFDSRTRGSGIGGADIHSAINDWYQFFKTFAITTYLIALLGIGIHVLLNSTASGLTKARELFSDWAKGVIILFLMPIALRWVFRINEGLVRWVADESSYTSVNKVGSSFQAGQEWSAEDVEFRSPQYISKYTGRVTFGSDEANQNYIKKLGEYRQNIDLMRVMRAYAGATGTLGYTLLWYVLIGQLIVFLFLYYKRYFIIAFLIAVFPVTCIFNAISIMQGKKGPQISTWFKEILTNVFTQFFHAVIYVIITDIIVGMIRDNLTTGSGAANWVIIIVAINFVPEGEKIIKRMISSLGGGKTGADLRGSASGLKGLYQSTKGNIKQIMGGFKGGG